MSGEPFEDSPEPFMPGDDLPRPKDGDILIIRDVESTFGIPRRLKVVGTHGSLSESWDPTGEDAWAMMDANDKAGFKGHWYAYGHDSDGDPDNHDIVASYEVASIISN